MAQQQQQQQQQPAQAAAQPVYYGGYPSATYVGRQGLVGYPSYYPIAGGSYAQPVGSYRAVAPGPVLSAAPVAPLVSGGVVTSSIGYAPPAFGSYYPPNVGYQQAPQFQPRDANRGYFYDDYIHDAHSPRRSYAGFRPASAPVYEGDVIYRKTISREDDFVLPRRSPPKKPLEAVGPAASAQQPQYVPAARSVAGPTTIEVVEAKDLPTSILDKTDPYVLLKVGGQTFKTRTIADAGKAARWNETFTVPGGLRAGSEGVVEVWDKDILTKADAIGATTFYIENGDRWFSLKPKGQVRLNVSGCN